MKNNRPYSETIDPTLAQTVRMIPLAHERFATDWMGEPQGNTLTRLVARQEPTSHKWTIDRLTVLHLGGKDVLNKESGLLKDLCAFDALHYCHTHQTTDQEVLGKIVLPTPEVIADDTPHYRATATASHQVFDINTGALCPVARGEILVDGDFEIETYTAAKQSVDVALINPDAARMGVFRDQLMPIVPKPNALALPSGKLAATTQNLKRILSLGDDMIRTLKNYQNDYYPDSHTSNVNDLSNLQKTLGGTTALSFIGTVILVPATLLGAPLAAGALVASAVFVASFGMFATTEYEKHNNSGFRQTVFKGPGGLFFKVTKAFTDAVESLPDEMAGEKQLCRDFAMAAECAYHMERAIHHAACDINNPAHVNKQLSTVTKAARAMRLPPPEEETLKQKFAAGHFSKKDFLCPLENQWSGFGVRTIRGALREQILALGGGQNV